MLITAGEMGFVVNMLNTHAVKLTEHDKALCYQIGQLYRDGIDVTTEQHAEFVARITLVSDVINFV